MYAAAESLPGVPVPRPSSASLARYRTSRMTAAVSGAATGAGPEAEWRHAAVMDVTNASVVSGRGM
jgi:hypothetical protein